MRRRVLVGVDEPVEIDTNGHDFVDMGEAGIWATCNVGATSPEDSGLYFAWGETKGYRSYQIGGSKKFVITDYKYCNGSKTSFTKYCTNQKYGIVDNKTVLDLDDDAARVNMGGTWRMPSENEFKKLMDLCEFQFVKNYNKSGMSGGIYKLKKDQSKFIFLPSCGVIFSNELRYYNNFYFYWANTLSIDETQAMILDQENGGHQIRDFDRHAGLPVRGFISKK